MYMMRSGLPLFLITAALFACGGDNPDNAASSNAPAQQHSKEMALTLLADSTSAAAESDAIISVNPDGLKQGAQQYLMLLAQPNGDSFSSKWSVTPASCGNFADNGEYQNSLFAPLDVPVDASEDCQVSVTIKDGEDNETTFTKTFSAAQPVAEEPSFSYRKNGATAAHNFTLPAQSASYTVPARYYDSNAPTQIASSLKIPDGWSCIPACANRQIPFTDSEQAFTIAKGGMHIKLRLLADDNSAQAVLNRADLDRVRRNLAGKYYQLAAIDLGGILHQANSIENRWTAIGGSERHAFTGHYDGQQLPIRNLRIQNLQQSAIGLFGNIAGAMIQNMRLQGIDVHGRSNIGGLAGYSRNSSVYNSYARGNVFAINDTVGGLLGYNYASDISHSYAHGTVAGNSNVGGLVGQNRSYSSIEHSYASGSVSGDDKVGGLLGWNRNYNAINNSYASGTVAGNSNVGGLIGKNGHSSINNSFASGDVSGDDKVGGLLGDNAGSTVNRSYATGSVAGNSHVGGLVGENADSSISHSYWDKEHSGQPHSNGGSGKTSAEMQRQSNYGDWDFDAIWGMDESSNSEASQRIHGGYPYLRCMDGQSGYQRSACAPADGSFTLHIEDQQLQVISANNNAQNLSYDWRVMLNGRDVTSDVLTVNENDPSKATFTAATDASNYQISVTISNEYGFVSTTNFQPPKAVITNLFTGNIISGNAKKLSAKESTGTGLSYLWTLERAPDDASQELLGKNSDTLNYNPDKAGKYRLKLTVSDASGMTDSTYYAFGIGSFDNKIPNISSIISVDSSGLQKGRSQYLMALAHDPDGDMLFISWSVDNTSCGTFSGGNTISGDIGNDNDNDNGNGSSSSRSSSSKEYQDSLFALFAPGNNPPQECTISVTVSDGYNSSSAVTQRSQPFPFTAGETDIPFSYIKDGTTTLAFNLPAKTARYTIPARYYDSSGATQTANSLAIPDGWSCSLACTNRQIAFTNTDRKIALSKDGSTIHLQLLANHKPATAILSRADLEYIDDSDENLAGDYYQLATIDLGGVLHQPGNQQHHWTPLGTYINDSQQNTNHPFTGTYDGQQLPLRNLRIQLPEKYGIGLFGYTKEATIQNVSLQGVDVRGNEYVGGLIGFHNSSDISNSYARGLVSGTQTVGGLIGYNNSGSDISNSYARGLVSGIWEIGGLSGYNHDSNISNSHANSFVSGVYISGGLIGNNVDSSISRSYASGNVSGREYIGGLVGINGGGISNSGISNSYARSFVSGDGAVGGLVGDNYGNISRSYATGLVSGSRRLVGGLVGINNGNISNSYWNTQLSGQSTSAGGEGKTNAEMQTQSSYIDWDFATTWGSNGGYPYLLCITEQYDYQPLVEDCAPSQNSFLQIAKNRPDTSVGEYSLILIATLSNDAVNVHYEWLVMHDNKDITDNVLTVDNNDPSKAFFEAPADGSDYQISVTIHNRYGNVTVEHTLGSMPKAIISSPKDAANGEKIRSAERSTGVELTYQWTLKYQAEDATWQILDTGNSDTFAYTMDENIKYRLKLTVTDAAGQTDSSYSVFGLFIVEDGISTNKNPITSGIISVDPDGLTSDRSQYLMVQAHDPDDDMLLTEWTVKPASCGIFADNGKYQDSLFAQLDVPANYSDGDCTVSVSIRDGYGGTAEATQNFTAPQPAVAGPTFAYDTDRNFTLPYKTARYTVPSHYYDSSGKTQSASSLQLPADWICSPACDTQIAFANAEQKIALSKGDSTIHLKLLASDNGATAILSRADLEYIDDSTDNLTGGYYQLAAINLEGVLHRPGNKQNHWDPIGSYFGYNHADNRPFTGVYNGQSLPIRNLRIQQPEQNYIALFGYTEQAKIENIALQGLDVQGKHYIGGLLGLNHDSDISNSYATGFVSGTNSVGGLVGLHHNSDISNSYATSSVSGNNNVGGLVGYNSNSNSNNSDISNSYATGLVSGNDRVGGLLGYNYSSTISNSYATGFVSGTNSVGGLLGQNSGDISNSYATSSVSGNNNVGGLLGQNSGDISNSYATSSVSGNNNVGGLLGQNSGDSDISNSYATGFVSGNTDVGGLIGYNYSNSSTISNSYWNTQRSGQSESAGGEGKTSAEMQTQSSYIGWDFALIWAIDDAINSGYPYLLCTQGQTGYRFHVSNCAPSNNPSIRIADGQSDILYPGNTRILTTHQDNAIAQQLSYQWLVMWDGHDVSNDVLRIDTADHSKATFTATADTGYYQISVTIRNLHGESTTEAFTLTVAAPPQAVITAPRSIASGSRSIWSATDSSGFELTYQWTLELSPYGASWELIGKDREILYYAPDKGGKYRLKLTVTDAAGQTDSSYSVFGLFIVEDGISTNKNPITSGIISADPDGLTSDRSQYLMVQAHDPDDDMLLTEWTVKPASCGTFADNGKYQDSLFAQLDVPANYSDGDCIVSVSIRDGYGGTAEATQSFTAPQPTIAELTFTYDTDRSFTLPEQTASYTVPARYYDDDIVTTADSLQLPAGWSCADDTCPNEELSFDTEKTLTLSKNDDDSITITMTLLASDNEATAILSRADLRHISDSNEALAGDYYQLATINLEGVLHQPDNNHLWMPIGKYSAIVADNKPFTGSYDGQQLPLRNIHIQQPEQHYIGLFGHTYKATIQNIKLQGLDVRGSYYVSGLVGYNDRSNISNSYASGSVSSNNNYVGGLIGFNINSNISNSYTRGYVSGNEFVGGLVGYNYYSSNISYSHANSYVAGNDRVGGLIGYNYDNSSISYSYATDFVSGNEFVGGLVGYNSGGNSISNSYASSTVSSNGYVGGLVGYNSGGNSISNSYASGDVSGNGFVGGLIGYNRINSDVNYSYASGNVSSNGYDSDSNYVGGLIGHNNSSTISDSYWDKDRAQQTHSSGSNDGAGKTTAAMQREVTYSYWLFGSIWDIDTDSDASERSNGGYPYLRCVGGQSGYAAQEDDCTAE